MYFNNLVSNRSNLLISFVNQFNKSINTHRFYTVIVERHEIPPIMKKDIDQRKRHLKSKHFHYKFVDCLHNKKWGNIDLILTQYVEGFSK